MLFFAYFSVSQKRNIKWNETFGRVIFGTNVIQGTWSGCQETIEEATRQGAPTPCVGDITIGRKSAYLGRVNFISGRLADVGESRCNCLPIVRC